MSKSQWGIWKSQGSVGEGGQSHVFKVVSENDPASGVRALKRLKNTLRLERFRREIEAVVKLESPHIPEIIDYSLDGDSPYYVMEYFDRGDLIKAGVLMMGLEAKLALFEDILRAMADVHAAGIVHRDIKPGNVLLGDDDLPRIADFGICFVEENERVTVTEEVLGPRYYCAPELEEGRQDDVDARADVYSLGKLLYFLCANRDLPREYHAREDYDLSKVLSDPRFELINKLLHKSVVESPDGRYKDAGDFLEAFVPAREEFKQVINVPSATATSRCVFCGVGQYEAIKVAMDGSSEDHHVRLTAGVTPYNGCRKRVMRCNRCGNVQVFDMALFQRGIANPWRTPNG